MQIAGYLIQKLIDIDSTREWTPIKNEEKNYFGLNLTLTLLKEEKV